MGVERLGGGKTGAVAITAATNVYGIFGDPVIHSLSPLMQNAAFAACGINAVYLPFNVTKANLDAAVLGAKAMNVRGVNVTIPHKEAVCPLLDSIDGSAQLIGAVNTIVNSDGCLVGYNTDGVGLVRSLRSDLGVDLNGNVQVVVLGAGGAARAAVVALAQQGVKA
ncbi:MAG: shikimate dehydrogenase, partial [Desulfobacteraceae bacterium 4572_35.1]